MLQRVATLEIKEEILKHIRLAAGFAETAQHPAAFSDEVDRVEKQKQTTLDSALNSSDFRRMTAEESL